MAGCPIADLRRGIQGIPSCLLLLLLLIKNSNSFTLPTSKYQYIAMEVDLAQRTIEIYRTQYHVARLELRDRVRQ